MYYISFTLLVTISVNLQSYNSDSQHERGSGCSDLLRDTGTLPYVDLEREFAILHTLLYDSVGERARRNAPTYVTTSPLIP